MMNDIAALEPKTLWKYFLKICEIPHPSKKEKAIIDYISKFAQERNLIVKTAEAGNLLVKKPASKGKERAPVVVLQSHVDMVCEKNASTQHNFDADAIQPYIDGSWVKAKGTTLGADDGIGVAAMLAILDDSKLIHGPLECLFTVDEETGLTGAFGLEKGFFEGKTLINLDSEDEGILFIGCAGGMTTTANLQINEFEQPNNAKSYKLEVKGLQGGHSGDDINKGLGNAIKLLVRILYDLNKKFSIQLMDVQGGNLHNAIAREAWAVINFNEKDKTAIEKVISNHSAELKNEYQSTEKNLSVSLNEFSYSGKAFSQEFKNKLVNVLYGMPHGVISMSHAISGLVQTSTNLASIKRNDSQITIVTSQRSDSDTLKKDIGNKVLSAFRLAKIDATQSEGYPGWKPNIDSNVLKVTKEVYIELFQKEPKVTAIHAGLECGLFLAKYPGLDMVSFGPTIKGAHSPDERLEIESVSKFWKHLVAVLEKIG